MRWAGLPSQHGLEENACIQCRHCPRTPTFSFRLHTATQTRENGHSYRTGCPRALFPPASPPQAFTSPQHEHTNSHRGSNNCLGPPQHRSWDPQGLRGGETGPPHTPLPTRGCNIPQKQGCVPRDYMARGSPLQPHTSLCPPAAPGGGLHAPSPPAPQDPLPSLRGPGGCSPFHLRERGAPGCPGEEKRGEKRGKRRKKGQKKRLAPSEPPEARPSQPLPQAADPV